MGVPGKHGREGLPFIMRVPEQFSSKSGSLTQTSHLEARNPSFHESLLSRTAFLNSDKPKNPKGFTLTEVIVALLLLTMATGGTLTAFLMGRVSSYHARYHAQAMNLLQAKVEELAAGSYKDVKDEGPLPAIIDPGLDLESGTKDDLLGSLWVQVNDRNDFDGDGNTAEQEIDLDGDGVNDPCKPVRVSLTWTSLSYGGDTPQIVSLETLIANK